MQPKLRKFLERVMRSPVVWANFGPASQILARAISPLPPPILLLSLPRSGSSWVGNILGLSNASLYLREPINQSYLDAYGRSSETVFEVTSRQGSSKYKAFADSAFMGLPVFSSSIVMFPEQWSLGKRAKRRLVIKEVNPLAVAWLVESYRPKVIYLIRHPAAVANSFARLGWVGKQFEHRFTAETLAKGNFKHERFSSSFWAEQGALQAVILQLVLDELERNSRFIVTKYEDLCANPLAAYQKLYAFAELEWDSSFEEQILLHSNAPESDRSDGYNIFRNSRTMIDVWRSELSAEEIDALKEAYLSYDPRYYGPEEW